jgi:hypothetical protein
MMISLLKKGGRNGESEISAMKNYNTASFGIEMKGGFPLWNEWHFVKGDFAKKGAKLSSRRLFIPLFQFDGGYH